MALNVRHPGPITVQRECVYYMDHSTVCTVCMCLKDYIVYMAVIFVYCICIQICGHAAFGSLPPTHHSPSHFALILHWLDKNKE